MSSLRYSSHEVILEPQSYTLRVGSELLRPEPKVFELLSYLMRNPGRLVSKEELLDSLWSGEVVGESVLTRCVSCARKLIQDDPRTPKFVRTAHGRGYEFVAPVAVEKIRSPNVDQSPDIAEASASTAPPAPRSDRRFVGRVPELAKLCEAVRNLRSEQRKVILVSGEAGIGKTRLLQEVAEQAALAEVHWSRASETDGAPPFFVWRQCFRSIAKARSMKVALRALGDATGGTRKLLLGMDRFSDDEAVGWDSPSTRFRTFDAIVRGLTELATQRDLVLIFDDLHYADLTSLLLLAFFAEQASGPILLLGAMRDGASIADPAKRAVLTSLRSKLGSDVSLTGLSRNEVGLFLGEADEAARNDLAQRLFSRTGGNPFFLSMLVPEPGHAGTSAALPTAVRQAVLVRLGALPGRAVELLRLAAVFSSDFDATLLSRASGIPEAECADHLRASWEARLISPSSKGGWAFVHDLVREVLYSELRGDELSLAHYKVGSALEWLPEYQEARHAATLARHMVLAVSHAGATRALDLSIRAGAHALRSFAYEEAVEHFSRSRELLPACTDVDPATECAVLLDLGLSQVSAGQRETAQSTLQLAAEKARVLGATDELARVALSLAPGLFAIETGVYDPALVALLREALDQVGHGNQRLRALLLGRLALALYWSDTFEQRRELCEEARQLAESLGAPDVLAAVTTTRAFALLRPENLDERQRLAQAAIPLSQQVGDRELLILNRLLLCAAELERGDLPAAAFEADAFRALAEETRQPQALWIVQAHRACRLLMDGRLDEVEALSGQCLAVGMRARDHNALLTFGVHLTLVRIEQGRASEVLDSIRDYAARYPLIVGWRVLHSYALSHAGNTTAAEAEYRSLKGRGFNLPDDLNWMVSMAWLAELCHRFRDGDAAQLFYERLTPYAERLVVVGYAGIACLGSVHRYLGLLASTLGRAPEARGHFDAAVEINRRASATLPLVHSLRDYGILLSKEGDDRAAQSCLEEAEALARARNLTELARIIRTP
jgi:DNA-binding winged helix-turn-helix (wHTH) protein/tetratricopeptide (TPR) repeat protein